MKSDSIEGARKNKANQKLERPHANEETEPKLSPAHRDTSLRHKSTTNNPMEGARRVQD